MKKSDFKDYYAILGIEFGCKLEDIKSKFRELAKTYHPDVNRYNDNEDESEFRLILEAYKVLSEASLKERYDKEYLKYISKSYELTPKNLYKTYVVEHKRIEYKMSLLNISKAGFKLSPKKFSRDDYLDKLGEDIVITLTDEEITNGAIAPLSIPARTVCQACYGSNRNCYLCDGKGYITVVEKINIFIPPGIQHLSSIEVDTNIYKKRKIISFSMKKLIVKVKWLSMEGLE